MSDKALNNPENPGRQTIKDVETYGDCDLWRLLCRARSEKGGWMKTTQVMQVGMAEPPAMEPDPTSGAMQGLAMRTGGCLVQVTTQQRNQDGSYAVAEAVTFVPFVTMADFPFPE